MGRVSSLVTNTTHNYKGQEFTSHSAGGQEVQHPDISRFSIWQYLTICSATGSIASGKDRCILKQLTEDQMGLWWFK